jgi:glycosyltransferase involved in cell wall biosynthesis
LEKHLHVVCLDVPYPADYGGAFEMFFKIKSLYKEGIKIHLHCFEYGRGKQEILDNYCAEVIYYKRNEGHKGLSIKLPYIVSSRANPQLLENLKKDDYPILFEGVHTTYYVNEHAFEDRKVFIRLHNAEYLYYKQLARQSRSLWKKIYYLNESRLLYKYEKAIISDATILAISINEEKKFKEEFKAPNVRYLPAFIGWDFPLSKEGVGNFCLYHGNLSVAENEESAAWLLKHVFNDLPIPFVIAGKNPSDHLEKLAHRQKHTCLVANPSEKEMQDLIQKAQINILPAFTETGIKFKLLNAVFCGRHTVVNDQMSNGTHLESACHIASNANAFKSLLSQLYRKPFDEEEIRLRENLLHHFYNNQENARQLIKWIW